LGASKLLKLSISKNPSVVTSPAEFSYVHPTLITSLISGLCERGKDARATCDLLIRIVSLLKTEMHKEAGINLEETVKENRKQRRKRESNSIRTGIESTIISVDQGPSMILPSWTNLWIVPICSALLQEDKSARWQVSSLFLPNLCSMIGGNMHNLCHVFACILDELVLQSKIRDSPKISEILLWAQLEVEMFCLLFISMFYYVNQPLMINIFNR